MTSEKEKLDTGRIGETLVELELLRRFWHVSRLDGSRFAPNGDLIALRGDWRHVIQVKATAEPNVFMGSAGPWIERGEPYFNRKSSPIKATAVVAVASCTTAPTFFIFLTDEAEAIAQSESSAYHAKLTESNKSFAKGFCKIPASSQVLAAHKDRWEVLMS